MKFLCTYLSTLFFAASTLATPIDIPPVSLTDNLFRQANILFKRLLLSNR